MNSNKMNTMLIKKRKPKINSKASIKDENRRYLQMEKFIYGVNQKTGPPLINFDKGFTKHGMFSISDKQIDNLVQSYDDEPYGSRELDEIKRFYPRSTQ